MDNRYAAMLFPFLPPSSPFASLPPSLSSPVQMLPRRPVKLSLCTSFTLKALENPILWDVSDDLDLGEILGTEEGIEALAEFIEKSGAFKKTGQLTPETREPRLEDATAEGGNEVDWEEEDGRIAEEASDEED